MSYNASIGGESIYVFYYAGTQIVTKMNIVHSCFVFASAKLNKKTGFCKVFARKRGGALQSFSHLVI